MTLLHDNPFAGQLDVAASLRDDVIQASLTELRPQDELTSALRTLLRDGVSIDDLSDASGLPADQIRRRVERQPWLGEDLQALSGAG